MAARDSTPSKRRSLPQRRERRIKVHSTLYEYRPKDEDKRLVSRVVPWIQLKGDWLAQAGFAIHAALKVRVMPGCLVVTVEDQEEE